MNKSLRFSHKILLAASLIVMIAFTLFTLYNDFLQRNAIREDLENYLEEMGETTSTNIKNLFDGRILLVQNVAQNIAAFPEADKIGTLLGQQALVSSFLTIYLGDVNGGFTIRPQTKMPDGYDPRVRPWYKDGMAANGPILTEPYIDVSTGKMVISVVATAARNVGVVGGDLALDGLTEIINSLNFGGMGYAFLINDQGKILVHPDKNLVMKSLSDLFPQNTPRISKEPSEVQLDGKTGSSASPGQGPAFGQLVHRPVGRQGRGLLDAERVPHLCGDCNPGGGSHHHCPARPVDPCADATAAHHDPRHGRHRRR